LDFNGTFSTASMTRLYLEAWKPLNLQTFVALLVFCLMQEATHRDETNALWESQFSVQHKKRNYNTMHKKITT